MRIKIIIVIALLICAEITAQNSEWINYTYTGQVTCLEVDENFTWIGTTGGLIKIEKESGASTFYNQANSKLPDNRIKVIEIDKTGNLWIGTDYGLVQFNGSDWNVHNYKNSGEPEILINDIKADNQNNLWISAGQRLIKFNGLNRVIYEDLFHTSNISIDEQNNIWMGYSGGIIKFDGKQKYFIEGPFEYSEANYISIDSSGNKWISVHGKGIYKYDDENWIFYNEQNSELPSNFVDKIEADSNDDLWILCNTNIVKFDGENWTVYDSHQIGNNFSMPTSIEIEKNGSVWAGFYGSGIAKFDGINWSIYDFVASGLSNNFIKKIERGKNGSLMFFGDGAIQNFNGETWKSISPSQTGRTIIMDSKGNFWGTFWGGIKKFENDNWVEYKIYPNDHNCFVNAIAEDLNGNIWAGTTSGLAEFDGLKWKFHNEVKYSHNNEIHSIYIDPGGDVWVLTFKEVYKYNGVNWQEYKFPVRPDNEMDMFSVLVEDDNTKWICTRNGLIKMYGGEKIIYTTSNSGMPTNFITSIYADGEGNKWIGTAGQGLVKFDGTNWIVYKINEYSFSETKIYAVFKDDNGNVWLGSDNGAFVFNEHGINLNNIIKHDPVRNLEFALMQNYPNPFNAGTIIKFILNEPSDVSLKIYNSIGQEITELVSGELNAGVHSFKWDAGIFSSGVYFYVLKTNEIVETKKLILLK